MKSRCLHTYDPFYYRYGGRGITICDSWMRFENFFKDMGYRPLGMTIERINKDGNYEPANCKWATSKEQGRNKSNNTVYTIRGKTACMTELAEYFGIDPYLVSCRIRNGMAPEVAFFRAKMKNNSTPEKVKEILSLKGKVTQREASEIAKVCKATIWNIWSGKYHKPITQSESTNLK